MFLRIMEFIEIIFILILILSFSYGLANIIFKYDFNLSGIKILI